MINNLFLPVHKPTTLVLMAGDLVYCSHTLDRHCILRTHVLYGKKHWWDRGIARIVRGCLKYFQLLQFPICTHAHTGVSGVAFVCHTRKHKALMDSHTKRLYAGRGGALRSCFLPTSANHGICLTAQRGVLEPPKSPLATPLWEVNFICFYFGMYFICFYLTDELR